MQEKRLKNQHIRILKLPKLTVLSYRSIGDSPEESCWNAVKSFIEDNNLYEWAGFRHIGFGFNEPTGEYGYELWISVPDALVIPEPYVRKEIESGLYACYFSNLETIMQDWEKLHQWVLNSEEYAVDLNIEKDRNFLEEVVDIEGFNIEGRALKDRQIDLLLPVARLDKKDIENRASLQCYTLDEPEYVILPAMKLAGCRVEQKENTKIWKRREPWYMVAQALYKDSELLSKIIEGKNTFSYLYGNSEDIPFYLKGKSSLIHELYAAVEVEMDAETEVEELVIKIMKEQSFLRFSCWVESENAKLKALNSQQLYIEAKEYCEENEIYPLGEFCLERLYRSDGRIVDRIDLLIPISDDRSQN